jgi:putative addiction module killer protein
MFDIETYHTAAGQEVFANWLRSLRDTKAKTAIIRRIDRIANGHFGDHKPCRDGVWELRIDIGPGYRAYYARSGKTVILLLCGGDKRSQNADIKKACEYWRDWQHRNLNLENEQ